MDRDPHVSAVLDMEKPVDVLREEHRATRRMVGVLFELADRVGAGGPFPASDVAVVLNYFREFVELVHHQKESAVFYPFAAMVGGDDAAESVGELIADHDESKTLLHSLTVFWEPTDLLEAERAAFAELARTYGGRLLRHMEAEEQTLFPAAAAIPGDDRIRFLEEFEAIESGYRTLAHWLPEITRLEGVYR